MKKEGIIQIRRRRTVGYWSPAQGPVLTRLLGANSSLSQDEKDRLTLETVSIMCQCVDPKVTGKYNTGLIMGYVQSGKTLSFTSLSALAHDNNYQIILLLAGTTNNLVEQSFERLRRDLEVEKYRDWKLFSTRNGGFQNAEVERIKGELTKWRRNSHRSRTILIVSMKNHHHLKNLKTLLGDINLENVPTLIIDDEGDQSGMNTKALTKEESTTHKCIRLLRECFPYHSYLLYTATPQAPLLISRIDTLSPDFAFVLTPGDHYVGGKEFFVEDTEKRVKLIPNADVPDLDDPPRSPPKSLMAALKDFFVGVAIGLFEGDDQSGHNRSMMIHPAIKRDSHLMFTRWARNIKEEWKARLESSDHPGRTNFLAELRETFDQLTKTYAVDYSFEQIEPLLFDAISETAIEELNTREKNKIPSVDWCGDYSWILVGGIGLDRGFTVEGLTISYMPRSIGVGNADSIQQRARFFGYKKRYLGLCRIYLTRPAIHAFESYVSHEESVRQSISQHIKDGRTLKDWPRTWVLSALLKPTRRSVILLDMYKSSDLKGWIYPDYPYKNSELVAKNRETVDTVLTKFNFQKYKQDGWNESQTIPAFSDEIPLVDVIPFIGQFRYGSTKDSLQHSGIMLILEKLAGEDPDLLCSVYAFSGPWSGVKARRSLDNGDPPKIRKLFQGRNYPTNYPGAREIRSQDAVTFQIHRYDLEESGRSKVLLEDLPVLAVYIPEHLNERVWSEREGDVI